MGVSATGSKTETKDYAYFRKLKDCAYFRKLKDYAYFDFEN